jgi:hypothetical protein
MCTFGPFAKLRQEFAPAQRLDSLKLFPPELEAFSFQQVKRSLHAEGDAMALRRPPLIGHGSETALALMVCRECLSCLQPSTHQICRPGFIDDEVSVFGINGSDHARELARPHSTPVTMEEKLPWRHTGTFTPRAAVRNSEGETRASGSEGLFATFSRY